MTISQNRKDKIKSQIRQRVSDKILEANNGNLLIKLVDMVNEEEADAILQMATNNQTTGLHFDSRFEVIDTENINYLEKDKEHSFIQDENKPINKLILGDNYKALRNLLISYKEAIDVIYIDPPYASDSMGEHADTNYTNSLTRDNLLSMLQPRLELALDLLSDEGIIFVSIDDKNQAYVKCLMDEIFGENNFIENFVWCKNATKNLSKTTSTNHEYIICYAKNKESIENGNYFRVKKQGFDDIQDILKKGTIENWTFKEAEEELRKYYKQHPELKGISQYKNVDYGPKTEEINKILKAYTLADTSAPKSTGKSGTYEIIHPVTGKPVKIPTAGWRYTQDTMDEHIKNNLIEFYEDENHVPRFKRYLDTVSSDVAKSVINDIPEDNKYEIIPLELKAYRLSDISAPKSTGKAGIYDVLHPVTKKPCKIPSRGWAYTENTMNEMLDKGYVWFGKDENNVPQVKRYLDTVETEVAKSAFEEFHDGKKELASIFIESPFDNPKPVGLIKYLLSLIVKDNKNAIVLDFFAGSGTTGQAVMELNKEDGGNRTFILNTLKEDNGDIGLNICAERLKRTMTGSGYNGETNFEWLKKNQPYQENLEVLNIASISNTDESIFEKIDETIYGLEKMDLKHKID